MTCKPVDRVTAPLVELLHCFEQVHAMAELDAVRALLEKKATFEQGVKELTKWVSGASKDQLPLAWPSVSRVRALLKARYSGIGFWRAGQTLFAAYAGRGGPEQVRTSRVPELCQGFGLQAACAHARCAC